MDVRPRKPRTKCILPNVKQNAPALVRRPEELVYQTCYAPVDVGRMLESAETRSRIRRLPAPQLYFGIQELEDEQIVRMLPHLTEEQWQGILDLDLWEKDRLQAGRFIYWQRHMVQAEPAVARKLIRAVENEVWELVFRRLLKVHPQEDEDFSLRAPRNREFMQTPDGHYLLVLPKQSEGARLVRQLVERLYELDGERASIMLASACKRTPTELEDEAYQKRRRRLEESGFQDYYDAIEIYTPLSLREQLPEKHWVPVPDLSLLPTRLSKEEAAQELLFEAISRLGGPDQTLPVLEELFFVCNKILSADRVSAARPHRVKRGIRKAVTGINLGLDCWAKGNLEKALLGIRKYYLQSFFRLGVARLLNLQSAARILLAEGFEPEPGSVHEALIEGLLRRYPLRTVLVKGKIRRRFFRSRRDLEAVGSILERLNGIRAKSPRREEEKEGVRKKSEGQAGN